MGYKHRLLHDILRRRNATFRAILITGPRRSGKSTLCREVLREWGGGSYVQFDTPEDQQRFRADPEGFLRSLGTPVVLDEVQNVPDIFNYLKKFIDADPEGQCDFILTGSQQFQMMRHVTESLSGRILIKELLPFAVVEAREEGLIRARRNCEALLAQKPEFELPERHLDRAQVIAHIVRGGFPQMHAKISASDRDEWFNSYLGTYLQRDIRSLSAVQDLASFARFVQLVAGRTGCIINYSELGKDIAVTYKTAQHYLSLLEGTYLWRPLPAFYPAGSEKRITKSPKGIFLDTGLASYLTGLSEHAIERNPLFGNIFESFVVAEVIKLAGTLGKRVLYSHFRARERVEVDLVLETGGTIIPIEIKSGGTICADWARGIQACKAAANLPRDHRGYVISLHPEVLSLGDGVVHVPLTAFL